VGEHRGEHNQFQKSNRTGAKRSNMEKSRKPKGFSLHSSTLAIYLLLCPLSPAASGRGQLFKNTHTIGGFLGIFQMVRGGFLPWLMPVVGFCAFVCKFRVIYFKARALHNFRQETYLPGTLAPARPIFPLSD